MKLILKFRSAIFIVLMITGTSQAQTQLLTDGGFEAGPGGTAWVESSTNFPTLRCDLVGCGNGSGSGPRSGNYWAWFGGFDGGIETGTLSQTIVLPAGETISLQFYLEQILCDSPQDFLNVDVDGTTVFQTDGSSPLCGNLGYTLQTVNLTPFADGNPHTITFTSTTFSVNGWISNFFIDDVSVICITCATPPTCNDTIAFMGLSIAIPDNDPSGVTNSQTVSGVTGTTLGGDVKLSQVCFKIDHTWVGDVTVLLEAPNGTSVVLLDRAGYPATFGGCSNPNIDVCVELGTGNEMENICNNFPAISGTFTAANGVNLNVINIGGGSPNGTWRLFAMDTIEFDFGEITEWKLIFDDGPVANWSPPATVCQNSGPIDLTAFLNGTPGGTWSGTGVTGNILNPSGLSGSIPITYTVIDIPTGCSDTETHDIYIESGPPVASFIPSAVSLEVFFTNTTTSGTTYLWDFGDLSSSTSENPSHTYALPGTYSVTLTATNVCGTNVFTQQVIILDCPDIVDEGGFEDGPGGGSWTEYSLNFSSPVCDLVNCGTGDGSGPRSGLYWSFFGGVAVFEESSVEQTFTIPVNSSANLNFWLEQIVCDGPADFLKIAVDADTVFTTTGTSSLCGILGYSLQTVNLTAYADGAPHSLKFLSKVYGLNGGPSSFFVDDVSLNVCIGVSMPEINLDNNVKVLPVPANDFFDVRFNNLHASNVTIEIVDVVGKLVQSVVIPAVQNYHSENFNTSTWNKGIYVAKITASGNSVFRKIVVQ